MQGNYSFKLDAYSASWSDCNLSDCLDYYHLSDAFAGFWKDAVPCFIQQVYGDLTRFVYNNIVITFWQPDFEAAVRDSAGDFSDLPNHHFRKIIISMMGQGLDYMRSLDLDVDSESSILRVRDDRMHITRCDFAFDFINYDCGIDIFSTFEKFVSRGDTLSPKGRLCVRGHLAGLSFQRKYGSSERTFYIGSPASERVLRVYDKYLERSAAAGGVFQDTTYGDPSDISSWVRIELQTRKTIANKMLFASNFTPDAILEDICNFYRIYRSGNKSNFKSFLDYFSPETVHRHLVYDTKF